MEWHRPLGIVAEGFCWFPPTNGIQKPLLFGEPFFVAYSSSIFINRTFTVVIHLLFRQSFVTFASLVFLFSLFYTIVFTEKNKTLII